MYDGHVSRISVFIAFEQPVQFDAHVNGHGRSSQLRRRRMNAHFGLVLTKWYWKKKKRKQYYCFKYNNYDSLYYGRCTIAYGLLGRQPVFGDENYIINGASRERLGTKGLTTTRTLFRVVIVRRRCHKRPNSNEKKKQKKNDRLAVLKHHGRTIPRSIFNRDFVCHGFMSRNIRAAQQYVHVRALLLFLLLYFFFFYTIVQHSLT